MKKLVLIFFVLYSLNLRGQNATYLVEGFEDDSPTRELWSSEPYYENKHWVFSYGGYYWSGQPNDPPVPGTIENPGYNPDYPKVGNSDVGIFFNDLTLDTILYISPAILLDGAVDPVLTFWFSQYESIKGNDMLSVLFRKGPASPWEIIREYTDPVNGWNEGVIELADEGYSEYFTDTFQIAFSGIIGNGWGIFIDGVELYDSADIPKYVKTSQLVDVAHEALPAGSKNVPIQRLDVRIQGNVGDAILDSLTFEIEGDGVEFLESDSFKLYSTASEIFKSEQADTSTLISTGSIHNGKVVFADIDHKLLLGENYLWLTTSIADSVVGMPTIKFIIPQNGVNISDTLFPNIPYQSMEYDINEVVFFDDFDGGNKGWILEGDFEIDAPQNKLVGVKRDPNIAFSGPNILGTDLTFDGGYKKWVVAGSEYYAYLPEQNLKYYINVGMHYYDWSAFTGSTIATIEYTVDGGASWKQLWNSSGQSANSQWREYIDRSFNNYAKRQEQFQLRFGIKESTADVWPGFNIDNFALLGEWLHTDLAVSEILSPTTGCIECNHDTIKIVVKNLAEKVAPDTIPVYYGLWGLDSTLVYDTIFGGIDIDGSVTFTFKKLAAYPRADIYDRFVVGVGHPKDQDKTNDTLSKDFVIQDYLTPPSLTDFEFKGGIWIASDSSDWEARDMSTTIITDPSSPHIWVASATGEYSPNDTSWVESGCYNLTQTERHIVGFEYWSDTEIGKDGARLEYSVDGVTWHPITDEEHDTAWNWAIHQVDALGSAGWSGLHEWTNVKAMVPVEADTNSRVKFRLYWRTDEETAKPQGFAFNNFAVYPAPYDIGVSSVVSPVDACLNEVNPTSQVYITNYGYNTLPAGEPVIVGIDFGANEAVIDTLNLQQELEPGDSVLLTVESNIAVSEAGTYFLTAYTLIEDDPWFYNKNNDSTTIAIQVWPLPDAMLVDTIQSRTPNTVVIRANSDAGLSYIWSEISITDTLSTADTLKVPGPGFYHLTVTESVHGCKNYDTTYVELLYNDVGIEQIVSPSTSCELSSDEQVVLRVKNFGTDSLISGDVIILNFSLLGENTIRDTITLTESFYAYASFDYPMTNGTVDVSSVGSYNFKAYARFDGDTVKSNDTVHTSIEVFGYPNVDIGPDTIVKGLSYLLDAGEGFDTYLWSTGVTTQQLSIDTAGTYHIWAIDQNGCDARDTAYIWLKIRDLEALAMKGPGSSCARNGLDTFRFEFANIGTDTILVGDKLPMRLWINDEISIADTLVPTTDIKPGDTLTYAIDSLLDLSEVGKYKFEFYLLDANDLRNINDTIRDSVLTNFKPVVDFGEAYQEVKALNKLLDAGAGDNLRYKWQDNSKAQTFLARYTGTYIASATDTLTGCAGADTVFLLFDITDYKISAVSLDAHSCIGSSDTLLVDIMNNGSLPRGGANVNIAYRMNDDDFIVESATIAEQWQPGQLKTVRLKSPVHHTNEGVSTFEIAVIHPEDLRPENDTITRNTQVHELPVFSFGVDTLKGSKPYKLEVADDYDGYLWSTTEETKSINVNEDGVYWVIVTDGYGCSGGDTVYVDIISTSYNEVANDMLSVQVYPNPARGIVNINAATANGEGFVVEVFNAQNKMVFEPVEVPGGNYQKAIDMRSLPAGMYFIRIRNTEMYHVTKLIVY